MFQAKIKDHTALYLHQLLDLRNEFVNLKVE